MGGRVTIRLPKYVSGFTDRHGKLRLRFRRGGANRYMQSVFGTKAFDAEYAELLDISQPVAGTVVRERVIPGSVRALLQRYYGSSSFGGNADTRARNRSILERFSKKHGHRPVRTCPFDKLDSYIGAVTICQDDGTGGKGAARNARKQLKRLFRYAVKIGWCDVNPVDFIEPIKNDSTGFHTWTETEINQYRAYYPLGTQARLALEIYLWTGKRRSDGIRIGPQNVAGDYLRGRDAKTRKAWRIPIAPALRQAIDAMPRNDQLAFIVTAYGRPFSTKGFGNRFRKWCDDAGLPHCSAHGLRKAIMRRMAELNVNQQGMKSISLHSDDREVATYTRAANQDRLAIDAMNRLVEGENWLTQIEEGCLTEEKSVAV